MLWTGSFIALIILMACWLTTTSLSSCNIYRFKDVSIPDSIKTVRVDFIENRAQYINPQLSPRLTDKLRQKIVGQTRLNQSNSDNVDWIISGFVREYTFTTTAISNQQVANNRLTVTVHLTLSDRKADTNQEFDVSRSFDFSAQLSFQQAEAANLAEMIRSLTDDIFNKLFSNW